ncbi:MAG: hypothetical protein HC824_19325 [Synechococcales cyanobacterium RM1_1_8]|nr:hypothetical protein [Synechococcales cyanobacterium RM1_1_8]
MHPPPAPAPIPQPQRNGLDIWGPQPRDPDLCHSADPQLGPEPMGQPWQGRLGLNGWTLGLLLLALPLGVSGIALQVLAMPPDPHCDSPNLLGHAFRADLAQLQCLRQAMRSGGNSAIISGLAQLQAWPSDSPVYSLAQRLLEDWSLVAWSQAQVEFQAGRWEAAARLTGAIPAQIQLRTEAQERLGLWQQIQAQGEQAYGLAQAALRAQDWPGVLRQAETLASLGNDYWQQQGLYELPSQVAQAQASQAPPHGSSQQAMAEPGPPQPREDLRFALPVLVSLERLRVSEPRQHRPEFSAA